MPSAWMDIGRHVCGGVILNRLLGSCDSLALSGISNKHCWSLWRVGAVSDGRLLDRWGELALGEKDIGRCLQTRISGSTIPMQTIMVGDGRRPIPIGKERIGSAKIEAPWPGP
jgi:hypothetical protein